MHDGEIAATAAIDRAKRHANDLWKEVAMNAVRWVAGQNEEFTTDDVWDAIETYYPDVHTHEHRAMGAIMRKSANLGICVTTDRTTKTNRVKAHRRPVRIWQTVT